MKDHIMYNLNSGKDVCVSGVDLLQCLNTASFDAIKDANSLECEQATVGKIRKLSLKKASDWLCIANILYYNAAKKYSRDETFLINIKDQHAIRIEGSFSRIVIFPTGGSYADITKEILKLIKKHNITDRYLAYVLLDRVLLNDYPSQFSAEEKRFLDCLLVLLFCVETSRHFLTATYNLMILDLIICGGDGKTHYTWGNLFISGKGYRWDDSERKDFGGKYPLAVNSTGANNLSTLMQNYIRQFSPETMKKTRELTGNKQTHAVGIRGMTLIVHWCHAASDSVANYLNEASNQNDLYLRLTNIFKQRLFIGHDMPLLAQVPTASAELRQNSMPASVTRSTMAVQDISQLTCIVLQHKNHAHAFDASLYFHQIHMICKLVPLYVAKKDKKEVKGNINYTTEASGKLMKVTDADKKGKVACPACFTVGKNPQDIDNPMIVTQYSDKKGMHWYQGTCDTKAESLGKRAVHFFKLVEQTDSRCQECWPNGAELLGNPGENEEAVVQPPAP